MVIQHFIVLFSGTQVLHIQRVYSVEMTTVTNKFYNSTRDKVVLVFLSLLMQGYVGKELVCICFIDFDSY